MSAAPRRGEAEQGQPRLVWSRDAAALARPSPWCNSRGKRTFDVACATPVLAVLALPMLAIAVAVRVTSGSPVLFRQRRVGLGGQEFECLKFRTMRPNAGVGVTQAGDGRITAIGRILRRTKLDELPQLINVWRGEMSLVGPRPDLREFIEALPEAQRKALASLRPGITGAATLEHHHEEEMLAGVEPERLREVYVKQVLPRKLALDVGYAARASFGSDLKMILRTLLRIAG